VKNPTRILIVEDNLDDGDLLVRQLKKAQLYQHVKVIHDGKAALDFLTDLLSPCEELIAVFLDLTLPSMPGIEVLRKFRSHDRTRHLPVIVMTSSNAPTDLDQCQKLGVFSYVQKPVSYTAFTKAIADSFHSPVRKGQPEPSS
jgi:two-component system, response regulator